MKEEIPDVLEIVKGVMSNCCYAEVVHTHKLHTSAGSITRMYICTKCGSEVNISEELMIPIHSNASLPQIKPPQPSHQSPLMRGSYSLEKMWSSLCLRLRAIFLCLPHLRQTGLFKNLNRQFHTNITIEVDTNEKENPNERYI